MSPDQDDENFARLVGTLGPHLGEIVVIGGWAHRLFRSHPLAQRVRYSPLFTRDADIALPAAIRIDEQSLRERLVAGGFREEILGEERPPVTHYHLGKSDEDSGFYCEFLTPLIGPAQGRDGARRATTAIGGVTTQRLRYIDVLLVEPWTVSVPGTPEGTKVLIPNAVSFLAQKLLINRKRKPTERAKDVLYVHDTLELFGGSLVELRKIWADVVSPALGPRLASRTISAGQGLFSEVTNVARKAALIAPDKRLTAEVLVEACRFGIHAIFVRLSR
jgi:hypothetical protein